MPGDLQRFQLWLTDQHRIAIALEQHGSFAQRKHANTRVDALEGTFKMLREYLDTPSSTISPSDGTQCPVNPHASLPDS